MNAVAKAVPMVDAKAEAERLIAEMNAKNPPTPSVDNNPEAPVNPPAGAPAENDGVTIPVVPPSTETPKKTKKEK